MNRTISMIACCVLSFAGGVGLSWTHFRDGAQQGENGPALRAGNAPGGESTMAAPAVAGTTRREPQFENDQVKSWKSIIMPDQPLNLHRHENGRALIALSGGPLDVVDKDGKVIKTYNWERGKAYWLAADPPGEMHADVNRTGVPIEVIVVELKVKQQ